MQSQLKSVTAQRASASVSRMACVPQVPPRARHSVGRSDVQPRNTIVVKAAFAPPPVSATKDKFLENYKRPVAAIYNQVIQELLVQQHFMRFAINYQYNSVFALGVVSVFDQILEALPEQERNDIFNAYIGSLGEEPSTYRKDAEALEKATALVTVDAKLEANSEGSLEVQKTLARIAEEVSSGKLAYNKFFAIGLFRMLEITGAKEPSALEKLVKGVGVRQELVSKDLMLYKNVLSKLSVAKELMRDFMEREKKKQAERETEKAARAAKEAATASA